MAHRVNTDAVFTRWAVTWRHNTCSHHVTKWQQHMMWLSCPGSPCKHSDAVRLQHALSRLVPPPLRFRAARSSPSFTWSICVGVKHVAHSTLSSPCDDFPLSSICPNALKPNPNQDIETTHLMGYSWMFECVTGLRTQWRWYCACVAASAAKCLVPCDLWHGRSFH